MDAIEIVDVTEDNLSICRDLCNALMQYQAEQSHIHRRILAAMNFDNRLKPSFENSKHKKLLLAKYKDTPIAYAFANSYSMEESGRYFVPDWLQEIYQEGQLVFYPESQKLPATIGVFNNLYVEPKHQGKGIGKRLAQPLMSWLRNSAAKDLYVYVSNGNEAKAVPFYNQLGFSFSHRVLDGFITAYHQAN